MNLYFLFILLFFMNCGEFSSDTARDLPGETYPSFTEDGAWCWFSDPRAVYFEGRFKRTYCGWIDSGGNVMIGFFDHETRIIETDTIHAALEVDDHDNPSLFFESDGTIQVYYTRHSANDGIFFTQSLNPENIHDWSETRILALNDTISGSGFSKTYTYTNIIQLKEESGRLFLFWRGLDFKPNVSISDDKGKSWSTGKILILPERTYKNRRPYMKVASDAEHTIHIAFTDGHPRDELTNSIYYVAYKKGQFMKANDEMISIWSDLPLDPNACDKVYDASITGEKAWIWDIAQDNNGSPVLVYARFLDDLNHFYYYATYENGTWNNHKLVNSGRWFPHTLEGEAEREPNYSGGIVLDHQDPSRVILARNKKGIFEIEQWKTDNNGKDWEITPVTENSANDNVRPFVVRQYPGAETPVVLWMNLREYVHYTNYNASIKCNLIHPIKYD
jgi:hypothetical protein